MLVGPGENAGVIDVGDGIAAAIRIESHNHPSAIEPYQGAATGVGGILRDIFTDGGPARSRSWTRSASVRSTTRGAAGSPRASSPASRATATPSACRPSAARSSSTRPTRTTRWSTCCASGCCPIDRLVLGQATGVGNLAVLLGSTTGRDGIGGVSVLASAGFGDDEADAAKRPSVQVGDPFEEKRLIEACLALLDAGLVVGIQDLGGAGLTLRHERDGRRGRRGHGRRRRRPSRCASPGMEPFEVMTSESQERMLAIVEPDDLDEVLAICAGGGRSGPR